MPEVMIPLTASVVEFRKLRAERKQRVRGKLLRGDHIGADTVH